jgi:hypothetical protein
MKPNNMKTFFVKNKMYILVHMDDDKEVCCTDCQIWNCAISVDHYC